MKILLVIAFACITAGQASASYVFNYSIYSGGGYQSDYTPQLGSFVSGGTISSSGSILHPGFQVFSLGGEQNDNWFPFGLTPFSVEITGTINAIGGETFVFGTRSDDGSAFYVDGNLVVNNGFEHPPQDVWATLKLSPGIHTLTATYFENGWGEATFSAYLADPISSVPEPATWASGALMALLAGGFRLRRKI